MKEISPDLHTYLSQSDTFEVNGTHESQLAIIAGGDTNAITVSNVCYLLCQHPEYQSRLFEELSDLPANENIIDDRYLMNKSCLLSVINETLRLYPPVPGGLQRLTPPQGALIAGRYIPGDMIVSTPTYAIHRGMIQVHLPAHKTQNLQTLVRLSDLMTSYRNAGHLNPIFSFEKTHSCRSLTVLTTAPESL